MGKKKETRRRKVEKKNVLYEQKADFQLSGFQKEEINLKQIKGNKHRTLFLTVYFIEV